MKGYKEYHDSNVPCFIQHQYKKIHAYVLGSERVINSFIEHGIYLSLNIKQTFFCIFFLL